MSFFLGEQNEKIEEVLTAHLDKTYEKYVPQQVRKFVDSQIAAEQEEVPVRVPRVQRQTREPSETGRRNARQGTRQNTSREEVHSTQSEAEAQEHETDQSVAEPEETSTMRMGM